MTTTNSLAIIAVEEVVVLVCDCGAAAPEALPKKGGGRGRPVGSKDRRSPLPRVGHHDDHHYTLHDRCAAKLALLQLLMRLPLPWRIDATVRYLYALTPEFDAWLASGRSLDALALQLRTWLHRDLLPLASVTCGFTAHMAEDQLFPCSPTRLPETRTLVMRMQWWLHAADPAMPLTDTEIEQQKTEGGARWRDAREVRRRRDSDAALFELLWTLD